MQLTLKFFSLMSIWPSYLSWLVRERTRAFGLVRHSWLNLWRNTLTYFVIRKKTSIWLVYVIVDLLSKDGSKGFYFDEIPTSFKKKKKKKKSSISYPK
jgi:hypothetical protein